MFWKSALLLSSGEDTPEDGSRAGFQNIAFQRVLKILDDGQSPKIGDCVSELYTIIKTL